MFECFVVMKRVMMTSHSNVCCGSDSLYEMSRVLLIRFCNCLSTVQLSVVDPTASSF